MWLLKDGTSTNYIKTVKEYIFWRYSVHWNEREPMNLFLDQFFMDREILYGRSARPHVVSSMRLTIKYPLKLHLLSEDFTMEPLTDYFRVKAILDFWCSGPGRFNVYLFAYSFSLLSFPFNICFIMYMIQLHHFSSCNIKSLMLVSVIVFWHLFIASSLTAVQYVLSNRMCFGVSALLQYQHRSFAFCLFYKKQRYLVLLWIELYYSPYFRFLLFHAVSFLMNLLLYLSY